MCSGIARPCQWPRTGKWRAPTCCIDERGSGLKALRDPRASLRCERNAPWFDRWKLSPNRTRNGCEARIARDFRTLYYRLHSFKGCDVDDGQQRKQCHLHLSHVTAAKKPNYVGKKGRSTTPQKPALREIAFHGFPGGAKPSKALGKDGDENDQ